MAERRSYWGWLIVLIVMVLAGCAQPGGISATPAAEASPAKPGVVFLLADWEQQWQKTVVEGRKEGVVSIYSLWTPATRIALTKAFKDKYAIELSFTPFGRGAQLTTKALAEAGAGLYLADIYGAGSGNLLPSMKPANVLGRIKPLLVLPEVLDSKAWIGDKLPFVDEEGMTFAMIAGLQRNIVYNSTLVREGEITSYKDLLKPQYKGKVVMSDPSVAGGANATFSHLASNVWGESKTLDFMRALIKDQGVTLERDQRRLVEGLARGKYPIVFAPLRTEVFEFMKVGAPIDYAVGLEEENRISPSTGVIAVAARPANRNAPIIFLNWLLTKEGQSVFAPSFGNPSTRVGASTEGIDPMEIPKPGQKYFGDAEAEVMARPKWQQLAQEVIAGTMK